MEEITIGPSGLTDVEKLFVKSDYMLYTRWRFFCEYGFNFQQNWHFQIISHKLEDIITTISTKDTVINIPPGFSKSEMITIGLTAYTMGMDPSNKMIVTSYTLAPVAENFTAQAKAILTAPWHQDLFRVPMDRSTGAKKHFKTTAKGEVLAVGTGGSVTGFRAGSGKTINGVRPYTGAIITDDPLKASESQGEAALNKATDFQSETLKSRKFHPQVPRIMVMQRLSEVDPSGWAIAAGWDHLSIPAILTFEELRDFCNDIGINPRDTRSFKEGDQEADEYPLWPWKMTLNDHREDRGDFVSEGIEGVGSFVFSGQYMQVPNPDGGGIIKTKDFRRYSVIPDNIQFKIITMDTAWDEKTRNDFSVMQCWGYTPGGIYLLDQWRKKVEFSMLQKAAVAYYQKHRPRKVIVENKQSGIGVIQHLKNEMIPVDAVTPSKDKITRALDAQPSIEAGFVYIPEENMYPWVVKFTEETEKFPVGKNDDQVDCLVMAVIELCLGKVFDVAGVKIDIPTKKELDALMQESDAYDVFGLQPSKKTTKETNPWLAATGL